MFSKSEKLSIVKELSQLFHTSSLLVVCSYSGLSASAATKLRKEMRDLGVGVRVIRNSLLGHALSDAMIKPPEELLNGTSLVISSQSEENRSVMQHIKQLFDKDLSGMVSLKAVAMDHCFLVEKSLSKLVHIPTKRIAISMFMRQLASVIVRPQSTILTPVHNLIVVFSLISKKNN